jgi:hypothetical protein
VVAGHCQQLQGGGGGLPGARGGRGLLDPPAVRGREPAHAVVDDQKLAGSEPEGEAVAAEVLAKPGGVPAVDEVVVARVAEVGPRVGRVPELPEEITVSLLRGTVGLVAVEDDEIRAAQDGAESVACRGAGG